MRHFRTAILLFIPALLLGCQAEDGASQSSPAGTSTVAEQGTSYLQKNGEQADVTTLPSGLQYKVISSGSGRSPGATDTVEVHYSGKLIDGSEFDSSYKRGQPASFPVNRVIAGWTEALQLMKEGDQWQLTIPSDLGYGSRGAAGGKIPPDAVLVFDVELLKVK